jgi:hypothetical protein
VASLAVVATTFLLMCYWNSLYDKMWLQPLWLLFLTGAIFAERSRAEHPFATRSAAVLVIAMMAINLSMAIRAARGPWPDVDEATRVKDFIGSRDLVVTDWNAVSTIYQMMWAPNQTWDFVSDSGVYLSATPEVLRSKIIKTRQNGGTVYFLGLLDENRAAWDPMLGAKCGIPYDSLDQYRNGSTSVANFVSRGQTITLRRFDGQP